MENINTSEEDSLGDEGGGGEIVASAADDSILSFSSPAPEITPLIGPSLTNPLGQEVKLKRVSPLFQCLSFRLGL